MDFGQKSMRLFSCFAIQTPTFKNRLRNMIKSSNVRGLLQCRKNTMLVRTCISMLLFALLASCKMLHLTPSQPLPQKEPITAFTRVHVHGNIDVNLYTGNAYPGVSLAGDKQDVAQIRMRVKHGILQISLAEDYPKHGRVHADIRTHYLTSFAYKGCGTIIGENIHTGYLDLLLANQGKTILQGSMTLHNLTVSGSGFTKITGIKGDHLQIKMIGKPHVQLNGIMDAESLNIQGGGWLSMYWIKTDTLNIRARNDAFIQIAGTVKVLDLELWDKARFNGHYLRGTRIFAKTHGESIADIAASKRQHTLATDNSNIYFHEIPDMKADFMGDNGSVLDLREWELPFMEEVSRYNR